MPINRPSWCRKASAPSKASASGDDAIEDSMKKPSRRLVKEGGALSHPPARLVAMLMFHGKGAGRPATSRLSAQDRLPDAERGLELIRTPTPPGTMATSAPIQTVDDDALIRLARTHRQAAESESRFGPQSSAVMPGWRVTSSRNPKREYGFSALRAKRRGAQQDNDLRDSHRLLEARRALKTSFRSH